MILSLFSPIVCFKKWFPLGCADILSFKTTLKYYWAIIYFELLHNLSCFEHTHHLPNMPHACTKTYAHCLICRTYQSQRLSVKTWSAFTFPPGGNWQKKEQASLDRSDTSGAGSATQTTASPAQERRNYWRYSQGSFFRDPTEAQEWPRLYFSKLWPPETNGTVFESLSVFCLCVKVWKEG